MNATRRPLSPVEQRYLSSSLRSMRHFYSSRLWMCVAGGLVMMAAVGVLLAPRSGSPIGSYVLSVAAMVVVVVSSVLTMRPLFRDIRSDVREIESAQRAASAADFAIRSTAVAELPLEFGSAYAFQVAAKQLVLIKDIVIGETTRFPNDDFSIVHLLDEQSSPVFTLIKSRGRKLTDIRRIPKDVAKKMRLPEDEITTFPGRLEDLETMFVEHV